MTEKILVPVLGESITEATISKWLKNKGESIIADEPIVELETDKVNLEVPAPTDGILSEVSEGLAVTQKEKLASLAESVEFESESDYREKLVTLRESYFPTVASSAQRDNSENISEESSPSEEKVSGSMANYLSTMQRVIKK